MENILSIRPWVFIFYFLSDFRLYIRNKKPIESFVLAFKFNFFAQLKVRKLSHGADMETVSQLRRPISDIKNTI
jgi:hypothetical protein